jgi:exonuclease SbcC
MIPLRLTLKGMYSYQTEQTVDFESLSKNHLFGIFGPVGSGKSTILEAISYALYGETERLNARDGRGYNMMNLKSNELFIDFTFRSGAANSDTYRFTVRGKRDKKDFNSVKTLDRAGYKLENGAWVPIEDDDAEQIIGLSYDNFRRTIIIPQGKFQEFLQLPDAERTKMMKEIFNLDRYDLAARTDVVDRKNTKELENIKGQLFQIGDIDPGLIEAESQKQQTLVAQRQQLEGELNAFDLSEKQLQGLKDLTDKLDKHRIVLRALESRKSGFDQREQLIEQYEVCFKNFPDILKQREQLDKAMTIRRNAIDAARNKSGELSRQIRKAEAQFESVRMEFENRYDLEKQWKEYESAESILELDGKLSQIGSQKTKLEKHLAENKVDLEQTLAKRRDSEANLKLNKSELPDQKTLSEVKAWFEKQESIQDRVDELKLAIKEARSELSSLEEEKKGILLRPLLNEQTTRPERQLPLPDLIVLLKSKIKELKILAAQKLEESDSLKKQEALEQFASDFKEGDPCPLCGSDHHPHVYTGKGVKTRISQLTSERKKTERDVEAMQECAQDLAEINTKISGFQRTFEKQSTEIKAKSRELEGHNERFTWKQYDGKSIVWINKELHRAQSVVNQINDLEAVLEGLRTTIDKLNQDIDAGKEKLHLLTSQSSELIGTRKTLRGQINTLSDDDIDHLTPVAIKNKVKVIKQAFAITEERYRTLQKDIDTKSKDLTDTVARMETDENSLEQQQSEIRSLDQELHKRLESTGIKTTKLVEEILARQLNVKKEKEELLRFRACRTVWGEKLRGVLSTFASYFLLEENDQWLRTQMQRV